MSETQLPERCCGRCRFFRGGQCWWTVWKNVPYWVANTQANRNQDWGEGCPAFEPARDQEGGGQ